VDFIVQKVVILQTSEGFQHFLYLAAKVLDKGFILDTEQTFLKRYVFLRDSLLLFVNDSLENACFKIFRFYLLCFQIYNLPKQVHSITPCKDFPKNLASKLLQSMLEVLKWQDSWLQIGLQGVRLVIERLAVAAVVLTLIFQ